MKKNQNGFGIASLLLAVIIVGLVGTVGWLVYDRQKNVEKTADNSQKTVSSNGAPDDANSEEPEATDKTADWRAYTNSAGEFSLKYPKNWVTAKATISCSSDTLSIVLIGTKDSVGNDCYGNQGQMSLGSSTDVSYDHLPQESGLDNYMKESVTIQDVKGYKVSGLLKVADVYVEKGARMVSYSFETNNRVYFFQYRQNEKSPDLLSDFNTMVTETLSFE